MKGKAIYNPSGKAGEYSYWAVNFYNGCSADCEYCYLKRGVLKSVWSTTPTLKKSLKDPEYALIMFERELVYNLNDLKKNGLFFNFTSDPFLPETIDLNIKAMNLCNKYRVPVKALTKQIWWIKEYSLPQVVSIGYTLTGMDGIEKGASTNSDRIDALFYFMHKGYKTWASIEPVVEIDKSIDMISQTVGFVDHYKIGPLSGKKFELSEVDDMIHRVHSMLSGSSSTVYWKEGFIEKIGILRVSLPQIAVSRDFKWWK